MPLFGGEIEGSLCGHFLVEKALNAWLKAVKISGGEAEAVAETKRDHDEPEVLLAFISDSCRKDPEGFVSDPDMAQLLASTWENVLESNANLEMFERQYGRKGLSAKHGKKLHLKRPMMMGTDDELVEL